MKFRFPVIIIDEDFRSENISGSGIRALAQAIEEEGMEVTGLTSYGDLTSFAQQSSRASTFIVSIDDDEFINPDNDKPEPEAVENLRSFVAEVRRRNANIPIFLYGETRTSRHLPNDILRELHGFIHMFEDTPEFVARHIIREARNYLDSLPPPFFKALIDYAQDSSYSWHCPGHSGGVAFLKSPVGQVFHQFFGENMLRADVCNAVDELGQLLDHTGPVAASERNAARIFGSDHMFFVTNGTSTSNKMVWHANVAPGDIVVVDRNCHKSILHAIMMTGAIPVFLMPTRNHYGIIGPIPQSEFEPETIARKIAEHPFASQAANKKPRILTLTQGTYDGVLYNAERIKHMLSTEIDTLHFDEAWLPHASFHPFYRDMHAIGQGRARSKDALVFATQSTHKLLAGLSQASQILVQDSETRKLDTYRFNEAYLMHTSTSPQYSIIASCDVAAAMMEAPGGTALVEESIAEALDFRRAMRKVEQEYVGTNGGNGRGDDWWFKVWGPNDLSDEGIEEREAWMLKANERWHGFGDLAEDFNLLDPIKATIITPGLDVDGKFSESGIPAAIVTKYLAEHGIIVEKTGLYSFFIMFTIGITKGRWNSMVTELQQFKDDYDNNQPLWRVLPEFVRQYPQYERIGLRELCDAIHSVYKANDVARVTTEMYLSNMEPAMKPSDAWAKMAHRETERVAIDDLEGRITAILLTPYPPGIPLLIPGERFNRTIVQYLQFAREFNKLFPGFETDIHGLVEEEIEGKMGYFVDCVR
ncbi:arginine/lysine/ornithine decarboxylase [Ralstonia pseudosolanacearum]|uniref:Arginine/lysine/ornithine decarboxylase n=2 Tax=Ralstonia solanacearum species complex TaxID=3116862 RepID=A0A0S4WY66_RALSL|nr:MULTISPECIES: arginine/lysine/ornithine decarboxylase [Ralstonia]QWQ12923.1 arginine/lysine/ornithine decarboxylase [Ralstonia solanacearum]UZF15984.1 arginine/lysine/ornithine decarboxylase [Ralstonia solanacearum]UZF26091.1 arginine/lysine/ornithine decarboxylase [Ralstonia sp. RS642]UZF31067.1 arginine/lysine/ornithine decarboxylase [Ralstonia sp. RS650]CUV56222.1 putative orn/lys/arg decarboxylase, c-terminalchey-like protein [Ralstonia solanacearum]